MSNQPTASSITDPQLDDLLAELGRLRGALELHAPVPDLEAEGRAVCRACPAEAWPCRTFRTAYPKQSVIASQSPATAGPVGPSVIAAQSPAASATMTGAAVIAGQSLPEVP